MANAPTTTGTDDWGNNEPTPDLINVTPSNTVTPQQAGWLSRLGTAIKSYTVVPVEHGISSIGSSISSVGTAIKSHTVDPVVNATHAVEDSISNVGSSIKAHTVTPVVNAYNYAVAKTTDAIEAVAPTAGNVVDAVQHPITSAKKAVGTLTDGESNIGAGVEGGELGLLFGGGVKGAVVASGLMLLVKNSGFFDPQQQKAVLGMMEKITPFALGLKQFMDGGGPSEGTMWGIGALVAGGAAMFLFGDEIKGFLKDPGKTLSSARNEVRGALGMSTDAKPKAEPAPAARAPIRLAGVTP